MTAPIEDVSSLPGKRISDQAENPIGEVKEIYASDGFPMWVLVEMSSGIADKRSVFIPLARIKDENGELRVPYSKQRIGEAPEVDHGDGISEACDRQLRDYYGIDTGDQELRSDNKSYAAVVSEDAGAAERVENADELDTPDADRRTDESRERLHDPGSSEMRKVSAEDVTHNTQGDSADQESADGGRDDDARDDREGDDREGDDREADDRDGDAREPDDREGDAREADDREGDDRKADDRKDDKRTADERDEDQRTG